MVTGQMRYSYSWLEVIESYKRFFQDKEPAKGRIRNRQMDMPSYDRQTNGGWMGATSEQMLNWIESGYTFNDVDSDLLPDATEGEGTKWHFTDDSMDAEYQYDLDEQGELEYYLRRDRVESKPGISLRVGMGFHSGIQPKPVNDYGVWVGSLIASLEGQGYDLEIELFSHSERLIRGEAKTENVVEVTKFGEITMFSDFSAFFSPGGYRHLNHLVKMLQGENGKHINDSIGTPISKGYGISWNPDTRVLEIECGRDRTFPADMMNDLLRKVEID